MVTAVSRRQEDPFPRRVLAGLGDSPAGRDALLILGVALLARGVYFAFYLGSPFAGVYRIDQLYYRTWGLEIAAGDWMGAQPFEQAPLYAYLLGAFYRLVGSRDAAVLALQLLAGAATALLIAGIARRLFDRGAGLAAGLLAALYGPFLFYECAIMKTFLEPLLVLAALLAALRAGESSGLRRHAAAGLAVGLACLVREVHVLLLLPLLAAAWSGGGRARARRAVSTALLLGAFAAAVAPAVLHNRLAGGGLVGISAAGGENLYVAFGPYATGFYTKPPFLGAHPYLEHQDFRDEAFLRTGRPHSQAASSAYWFGEAWRFVREEPGATARLLAHKAAILFADFEVPDSENFTATRDFIPLLRILPSFGCIAGLGLLGLVVAASNPRRHLLPLCFAAALLAEILLTFNLGRYRTAFVGVWLVFAGGGAVRLWTAIIPPARRGRGLATAALVVAVSLLSFIPPLGLRPERRDQELERFRREIATSAGIRDSIPERRRALAEKPASPGLNLNLGMAMELTGRLPEALQLYREAVRLAPDQAPQRVRLADLLLRQNRTAEAAPHALALTRLTPEDEFPYLTLGRIALLEAAKASDPQAVHTALVRVAATLRTAASLAPDDLEARLGLARALYLAGERDAAAEQLREAARIDPDSPAGHALVESLAAR